MSVLFEWLQQVVHAVTSALGYPGIFLMMLAENLFPPIPSEVVMPFGGFMVADGEMNLFGILLAGTLGSLLGALIIYYIGYKLGQERLHEWVCKYGKYLLVSGRDLDRSLETFERHGKSAILIGRVIPGVRSLISIPAGIQQMKLAEFIGLTLIGTVLWNVFLVTAGYLLGANWRRVLELLDTYEMVIYIALGALVLWFLYHRFRYGFSQRGC